MKFYFCPICGEKLIQKEIAGFIKQGETPEEAAIREVEEETGQKVDKITYMSSYFYDKKELLMIGFRCDVKKRDFNNSQEV